MYKAVVIGASAGGFHALRKLLTRFPKDFSMPIFIVQHISPTSDNYMAKFLNKKSELVVKEADEKEIIKGGTVYISPPNYHLLIEEDNTLSLSTESKKNYSRPSIDILFESAAYTYGNGLIGVVLTGANSDGAEGLLTIKNFGGYCIVQEPTEAESTAMPLAAIEKVSPNKVLKLNDIANLIVELDK
jgi:two-component system chemotaxis response regulator CheB